MEPRGGGVYAFRLLGPVEVTRDGAAVAVGGQRQRALLALLLLRANEVVPRERIVDALWGEQPPETAQNAIQVAVHALRRLLGRERLETRGSGYLLHVDESELDLLRFERLLAEARADAASGPLLREALGLWRGPALADLREAPFAPAEAERLEELRLVALERRIDADLDAGGGDELVPELLRLVEDHPYRERLHAQLMLALYRAGRQAEALEAYGRARRRLVDELGMEPGPELQELERRILRQDAGLAPPAVSGPATNLPAAPTPLVGRELELAAVTALLRRDEVRLLTLTGAGGTGKTRLALAAAGELVPEFPDGVWLVALAPVRDPALVAPTVAAALGIGETGHESAQQAVRAHLRERRCLLVLDNFEQLADAAPVVADLLAAAPGLKVLVTSRAVLRLSAEHDYPVPPLPLPDAATVGDPAALLRNEAVALFVQRARAVRPSFVLDEHARAVADVCVALDGLPLALELAAARVKVLPPEALRDRLERRLPLLERGPTDLPRRQRTMRATIDWSHDLLREEERMLFARLAVFSGGCTVDAAEAVCGADLDGLTSLVDKSLLRERPGPGGDVRFAMLETVREYAAERLEEHAQDEELRRRHAEHFLGFSEQAEPELTAADAAVWLERLEAEHDNLRAALAWAAAAREAETGLRLAAALHFFWRLRGHLTEGRRWLEGALAQGEGAPPGLRGRALRALSVIVDRQGHHLLCNELLEQSLALFREAHDDWQAARTLSELGGTAVLVGDYDRATELFEETIPLFREAGDRRALMVTMSNLAAVSNLRGDYARGRELNLEALSIAREDEDRDQAGISLHNLGRVALAQDEHGEAAAYLRESVRIGLQLRYRELIANCLEGLAELALAAGDLPRAARVLGAAEALLDELGAPLGPEEREGYERAVGRLAQALATDEFAALRADGASLALEDAVALALED